MPPPSLYNDLTDEKDNAKTLKDLLLENYSEELKNILDDTNFIKKELSNEKLAILDILKWAYNPNFNYNNFELVYTVLESTKKVEVKRVCLKIISNKRFSELFGKNSLKGCIQANDLSYIKTAVADYEDASPKLLKRFGLI